MVAMLTLSARRVREDDEKKVFIFMWLRRLNANKSEKGRRLKAKNCACLGSNAQKDRKILHDKESKVLSGVLLDEREGITRVDIHAASKIAAFAFLLRASPWDADDPPEPKGRGTLGSTQRRSGGADAVGGGEMRWPDAGEPDTSPARVGGGGPRRRGQSTPCWEGSRGLRAAAALLPPPLEPRTFLRAGARGTNHGGGYVAAAHTPSPASLATNAIVVRVVRRPPPIGGSHSVERRRRRWHGRACGGGWPWRRTSSRRRLPGVEERKKCTPSAFGCAALPVKTDRQIRSRVRPRRSFAGTGGWVDVILGGRARKWRCSACRDGQQMAVSNDIFDEELCRRGLPVVEVDKLRGSAVDREFNQTKDFVVEACQWSRLTSYGDQRLTEEGREVR
ncbi:hypothetical protein B0H10DRAFT_1939792 [Mycena sp. CBHHK59/15]|nr:hypothetical protein B0H10DRAFT_1939792 [Mycena sp. CBHHK59/15]